jgi:hypothetical protein
MSHRLRLVERAAQTILVLLEGVLSRPCTQAQAQAPSSCFASPRGVGVLSIPTVMWQDDMSHDITASDDRVVRRPKRGLDLRLLHQTHPRPERCLRDDSQHLHLLMGALGIARSTGTFREHISFRVVGRQGSTDDGSRTSKCAGNQCFYSGG